ncbi:MAG: hypothetical protein ACK5XN_20910, partial [Bacteroidota bacterium]
MPPKLRPSWWLSESLNNTKNSAFSVYSFYVMPRSNIRNSSVSRHSGLAGYYPFGMQMQGREFVAGLGYKYGLQNWERDDVIAGRGNSYTTLYRQHDPRLSRTWSQDPKS